MLPAGRSGSLTCRHVSQQHQSGVLRVRARATADERRAFCLFQVSSLLQLPELLTTAPVSQHMNETALHALKHFDVQRIAVGLNSGSKVNRPK